MGTIGSAILEAMVNVENAVEDALLSSPAHNHFKASGPVKEAIKVLSGTYYCCSLTCNHQSFMFAILALSWRTKTSLYFCQVRNNLHVAATGDYSGH